MRGCCDSQNEMTVGVKSRECEELLYGKIFPLKLKGAVCKSNVRPAILYEGKCGA